MLERTDTVTNQVQLAVTFVLAYPNVFFFLRYILLLLLNLQSIKLYSQQYPTAVNAK